MLTKQPINISFIKGIDTKSDPYQLQMDSFAMMQNSVFTTTGRLTKRNGFANVTNLPNQEQTTLTTFNDNLIATGSNLYALNQATEAWMNQGTVQPITLNTLPLVRVSTSQTAPDTSISSTGLACLVYVDNSVAYYQISDSVTGQQVVPRTTLPSTAADPRAFILGQYFIITFTATVAATPHLQYIAIPISNPTNPSSPQDISTSVAATGAAYDAVVANNQMFIAWAASDVGGAIRATKMSSTLIVSTAVVIDSSLTVDLISFNVDLVNLTIWLSYWSSAALALKTAAYDFLYNVKRAVSTIVSNINIHALTSSSKLGTNFIFYEVNNNYASPYPVGSVKTDYVSLIEVPEVGSASSPVVLLRSLGLASKSFLADNSNIYVLATYGELNHDLSTPTSDQNTYFLIDISANKYMRLAYSNGGGYVTSQVLPSVSFLKNTYYVPYLIKDFISTTNTGAPGFDKTTNSPIPITAIYTQTGINLVKFTINTSGQYSSEIAGALHLTGGLLWEYDGVRPVEHGFHVWPDNVASETSTGAGSIAAGTYFYQFTYEWTDNSGNLHRSAPSVPISQATTTASSTNTLYVPTLRITDKVSPNPVRIVGYRWSVAQQVYYQFTSITSPTINNPAVDFVVITDTLADSAIIGNNIIYTTGSVIENIAAPASIHSALFNNRLWIIDAEDQNLLWFSKQVIEVTPVEMSDLLTIYVAPTTGAQGSTGPMRALAAMDDKLIIFKDDAIYYINGVGPDNTGANSTFSDPVYITGAAGCNNPNSIVLTPDGLMFQSDKGIWLLNRSLGTEYIGAPVEIYNSQTIESSETIPGTTQVRFILASNITVMYDYYFKQWGTFTNISAVSATLWQGKHTYLNSFGQVFQEALGTYVDGSTPVLLSLTSAWINLAGLQGLERFYFLNLLGTYYTPYKLNVEMAFNYNGSPEQSVIVVPNNFGGAWGSAPYYGGGAGWGNSPGNVFTARVFPNKQKCQSFQISIKEIYDNSYGVPSGQGLTLSGMTLVVGVKKGYRTQSAQRSFG